MHLIFTLGTNDSYTLTIITYGSGSTNTISGTLGRHAEAARWTASRLFNNDNGTDSPHDVFFNSLSVVDVTPIAYTINTSSSPVGGGVHKRWRSGGRGAAVTAVATANTGYGFVNWTESGTVVSTSATYGFMANTNRNLVANFYALRLYAILARTNLSAAGGSGSEGVRQTAGAVGQQPITLGGSTSPMVAAAQGMARSITR